MLGRAQKFKLLFPEKEKLKQQWNVLGENTLLEQSSSLCPIKVAIMAVGKCWKSIPSRFGQTLKSYYTSYYMSIKRWLGSSQSWNRIEPLVKSIVFQQYMHTHIDTRTQVTPYWDSSPQKIPKLQSCHLDSNIPQLNTGKSPQTVCSQKRQQQQQKGDFISKEWSSLIPFVA